MMYKVLLLALLFVCGCSYNEEKVKLPKAFVVKNQNAPKVKKQNLKSQNPFAAKKLHGHLSSKVHMKVYQKNINDKALKKGLDNIVNYLHNKFHYRPSYKEIKMFNDVALLNSMRSLRKINIYLHQLKSKKTILEYDFLCHRKHSFPLRSQSKEGKEEYLTIEVVVNDHKANNYLYMSKRWQISQKLKLFNHSENWFENL